MKVWAMGALAPVLALGACATIIEGTHQAIGVVTTPPGASCTLTRAGTVIAQVSPTPGQVQVDKSKVDIMIDCDKPGYQHIQQIASAKFVGTTFGNILLGGVIGVGVDAASGADNKYPESVAITMEPVSVAAAPPPAPVAPAAPAKAKAAGKPTS